MQPTAYQRFPFNLGQGRPVAILAKIQGARSSSRARLSQAARLG